MNKNNYYVYAYINPKNFKEVYYGKGKGNRKNAHLYRWPNEIVRVIATDLTEQQAYFVEAALIWQARKDHKKIRNKQGGKRDYQFRPEGEPYALKVPGFDYQQGLYRINVGDSGNWGRVWEDSKKYNFISAGHGKSFSDQIRGLKKKDIMAAYLNGSGYVGIGRVKEEAVPMSKFKYWGKLLISYELKGTDYFTDSEYGIKVSWIKVLKRENGRTVPRKFGRQGGTVTPIRTRRLMTFLEKEFNVNMDELLSK